MPDTSLSAEDALQAEVKIDKHNHHVTIDRFAVPDPMPDSGSVRVTLCGTIDVKAVDALATLLEERRVARDAETERKNAKGK